MCDCCTVSLDNEYWRCDKNKGIQNLVSSSFQAILIPFPPPPADALIITGYPSNNTKIKQHHNYKGAFAKSEFSPLFNHTNSTFSNPRDIMLTSEYFYNILKYTALHYLQQKKKKPWSKISTLRLDSHLFMLSWNKITFWRKVLWSEKETSY